MNKYPVIFSAILFCTSSMAAESNVVPDSFDLVCDTVDYIGFSLGKDRISQSYVKWNKQKDKLGFSIIDNYTFHKKCLEKKVTRSNNISNNNNHILKGLAKKSSGEVIDISYRSSKPHNTVL